MPAIKNTMIYVPQEFKSLFVLYPINPNMPNTKADIIKTEKNNKNEQENPMDYIQFLQWRKNYVKEKPNHSKFMDTWRSVQI